MNAEYSIEVIKELEEAFQNNALNRPMHVGRYDPGTERSYDISTLSDTQMARVRIAVEKFVGGGFAGQVYRVKLLDFDSERGTPDVLEAGRTYAMKILIPPTGFSRFFRNSLYWIGFQGPFQLQVNPAAARAGALWQKFIRRGAKIWFGDESTVADIHATFVDNDLGSCGELSEWIEGRTWRLEVDDRLDLLRQWQKGKEVDPEDLGSPEYRAKYVFMHRFVELLHQMGGHEFARQYEWTTWKSQPNCLKRRGSEASPAEGMVAVDFRAGLALLPFLPMSPGDIKLILNGLARGSLVQFDRGDIHKLEQFIQAYPNKFADMAPMLEELKRMEELYRDSIPDLTHHHVRLLYSPKLWLTMFDSAVTGWRVRNLIDETCELKFRRSRLLAALFFLIGLLPILGRIMRRIWCQTDWRKHYFRALSSWGYFKRAVKAKAIEKTIDWHRSGRIHGEHALNLKGQPLRFICHLPLSLLPTGLHRFVTDWQYAKEKLSHLFVRPVRLYFDQELREQWLRDMVLEGKEKQLLSQEDANIILSQVNEPFIQKYLKSLAVHLCTLPVTQVVSVLVAIIYVAMHPEMPRAQAWGIGLGIIALFQVVPISPGSLVRGLYVLYLVIRERNFKDYNIAVFLGFFKYVGYLAFPIQMTYRYPTLARFMAGHWATEAVHAIPVFGERGALLEYWVFCLFYNWPLTLRRRFRKRSLIRAAMPARFWHIGLCAIVASGIFLLADFLYLNHWGEIPTLKQVWWLALLLPLLCGVAVTLGAAGAALEKRVIGGALCGGFVGILYAMIMAMLGHAGTVSLGGMTADCVWLFFIFTMLSTLGVLFTELTLPEPKEKNQGG